MILPKHVSLRIRSRGCLKSKVSPSRRIPGRCEQSDTCTCMQVQVRVSSLIRRCFAHSLALPARASVHRTAFPGTARQGRCGAVQVSLSMTKLDLFDSP